MFKIISLVLRDRLEYFRNRNVYGKRMMSKASVREVHDERVETKQAFSRREQKGLFKAKYNIKETYDDPDETLIDFVKRHQERKLGRRR